MRIRNRVLVVLLAVISCLEMQGADVNPTIEHITSIQGLSHNTIRYMLQDQTGYIWFGSLNGLNRYDGVRVKHILPDLRDYNALSNGKIKDMNLDSKNRIWIRTYHDLYHCYDQESESFLPIYSDKDVAGIKHSTFYEDRAGRIWLYGSNAGCMKISIDRKKINNDNFTHNSGDNSLPSNNVNDILEDSKANLWILTDQGLVLEESKPGGNEKFRKISNGNFIKSFELDGKVFFLTRSGNVYSYDNQTNKLIIKGQGKYNIFKSIAFNRHSFLMSDGRQGLILFDIRNNQYRNIECPFNKHPNRSILLSDDKEGGIWVSNHTGKVWRISTDNLTIKELELIPSNVIQLIDEERYQYQSDRKGNIWITTYGNGLFEYNLKTGNISHFVYKKERNELTTNYLLSLLADKNGNIWVGSENMGINKFSFTNSNVRHIYLDPSETTRNGNIVRSFMEDHKGNFWVSSRDGSLYLYDRNFENRKSIFQNSYNVFSMLEDKDNNVWMGCKGNGLLMLPGGQTKDMKQYISPNDPDNRIFSVVQDKKDRIWVASLGGGVRYLEDKGKSNGFRNFINETIWLQNARYLFCDSHGDLWAATNNNIVRFNPDSIIADPNQYKEYFFDPDDSRTISNIEIRYIFEDSKHHIWFATSGYGISKFIGEREDGNGLFETYSNPQGIASDNIMSMQEDSYGNLWVSSESGIHKFNPGNNTFQYFRFSNDFSSNVFTETASLECKDGRLVFGSQNGFYIFQPKDMQEMNNKNAKVFLTSLNIYDQDASIGKPRSPLSESITSAREIILRPDDQVFHIDFSTLNFADLRSEQFMYRLENFENRWNVCTAENRATYRNVPPGTYTFIVKAIDSDGTWRSEGTSITIKILPPFWKSNIAYIFYFILFILAAYFAYRIIFKFYQLNQSVTMERQLSDYKLRFFTNISHEFRTPLTLISGSVETLTSLKNNMSESLVKVVDDIDKNTRHLMRLIEQLLEFRKLQNNKQSLHLQRTDAVPFLEEIFKSFVNVAEKTNIDYQFVSSQQVIPVYMDKNKVDKIIFNLLSNAFKFTPRGGKIILSVGVNDNSHMLVVKVSDTGIGIPEEKKDLLFSRFMQINFSESGTGIGLSLVKEFTALHKGNVGYSENEGGGSVFKFELSLDKTVYSKEEFINEEEMVQISEFIEENPQEPLLDLVPIIPVEGKKFKLLVIDDNNDIREFLHNKLNPYFEVLVAEDGDKGMQMSMEEDPDLIICDVMMPGMNGFELTRSLKDNFETCHIPVILLTAYQTDDHHSEGIEAGADAYITKPFSLKFLMLQINKLLEKREKLHKHYMLSSPAMDAEYEDESNLILNEGLLEKDVQFLKEAEDILEKNYSNAEFTVDDFANMMNTGRTLFFKKIKSLTGKTPNELIRVRKMQKAAELLRTYKYNVSEVSYMVGINDPFYFSKCFKAEFGCSPSKYLNK